MAKYHVYVETWTKRWFTIEAKDEADVKRLFETGGESQEEQDRVDAAWDNLDSDAQVNEGTTVLAIKEADI